MAINNNRSSAPPLDPLFNSGIAYLERISKLMEWAHTCFIEQDLEGYFNFLTQIKVELAPRMTKEMFTDVIRIEKKYKDALNIAMRDDNYDETIPQRLAILQDYHLLLNMNAHTLKLVMPDKTPEWEAARNM